MMSDDVQVVPAGGSATQRLEAGQLVKVINTSGTQVIDTWAFVLADPREFMSMEHTRVEIGRAYPAPVISSTRTGGGRSSPSSRTPPPACTTRLSPPATSTGTSASGPRATT